MKDTPLTRRDFTKRAAGAAVGIGCSSAGMPEAAPKKKTRIALQLYTIRDLTGKDFPGTLAEVARIGYGAVEFAGYGGLAAKDMKKLLDDIGLVAAGTHEGFARLDKELDAVIEYNRIIGNRWLVCPSMPGEFSGKGAEGFRAFAGRLNGIGAKARDAGMTLCYHNHSFEFKQEGGKYLLDILLDASDPKLVKAEVDVYWVKHGGEDPAAYITRHKGRCPLLHMKDMTPGEKPTYAPVGTGILDMKGIVKAGRAAGTEWYIVEEDTTLLPPLESIAASLKNLRTLLGE